MWQLAHSTCFCRDQEQSQDPGIILQDTTQHVHKIPRHFTPLLFSFDKNHDFNLQHYKTQHQSQVGFMRKGCALVKLAHSHTFSAFWLRSSVVSVLISLISDTRCIASFEINSISHPGLLNRLLAAWVVTRGLGVALLPWLRTAISKSKIKSGVSIYYPSSMGHKLGRVNSVGRSRDSQNSGVQLK